MENEIKLSTEQIASLIQLAELELDPAYATPDDISKALISIEKKMNFFNYPLSFFTAEVLNVLIVDDMELSIHQLTSMLKKIGMNVFVARNKEEALTEIKKKKFDYVIIDLFLPDPQDGLDLIKIATEIKESENKNYRLVAISGTDDKEMVQKCYESGVDEFVSKQPDWHQKILKFISTSANRVENDEFHRHFINDNICVLSVYKINNQKYVDKVLREVNANVLTGKKHVILNMEYIKIFSDTYSNIFAEIYKSTSLKEGIFVLVKPSEDVLKALDYVFLTNVISIFETIEDAVEYIEMHNIT